MKTAICACIKNEHEYLKEWIEYHLTLGFDHIYLYEDFNSISHNDIVKQYCNVTLLPISIVINNNCIDSRQMDSVNYSLEKFKDLYDWIAFIDVDEFIRLESGITLHQLLNEYCEYDGIYLSWKMFGASNHIKKPNGGIQENYTIPELSINFCDFFGHKYLHKSIANLNKNPKFENIHSVMGGINMDGESFGKIGIYHTAWIDHYFTKSWEEWCNRILKRGDICKGVRRLSLFFSVNPSLKYLEQELYSSLNSCNVYR